MRKYEPGKLFKPKQPNRFWKAFKVIRTISDDTRTCYDVKCYGHSFEVRNPLIREVVMRHEYIEEMAEDLTEESFKNIVG